MVPGVLENCVGGCPALTARPRFHGIPGSVCVLPGAVTALLYHIPEAENPGRELGARWIRYRWGCCTSSVGTTLGIIVHWMDLRGTPSVRY